MTTISLHLAIIVFLQRQKVSLILTMFNTYSNRTTFNVPRLFEEEKNNDTISLNIAVLLFIFISNCARFHDCYEKSLYVLKTKEKQK